MTAVGTNRFLSFVSQTSLKMDKKKRANVLKIILCSCTSLLLLLMQCISSPSGGCNLTLLTTCPGLKVTFVAFLLHKKGTIETSTVFHGSWFFGTCSVRKMVIVLLIQFSCSMRQKRLLVPGDQRSIRHVCSTSSSKQVFFHFLKNKSI